MSLLLYFQSIFPRHPKNQLTPNLCSCQDRRHP